MKSNQEIQEQTTALAPIENVTDPLAVAEYGKNAASVLKDIVKQANLLKTINGKEYMMFEGWQTVAKFFKSQAGIEWTKPVKSLKTGEIEGFEARAYVQNDKGDIISTAESYCGRDEKSWANRPIFAIRSMAQTRASAKALRQVYSWVVVLAGYKATPLEEMGDIIPNQSKPVNKQKEIPPYHKDVVCVNCGNDKITERVYTFSMQKEGMALCFKCQKIPANERTFDAGPNKLGETESGVPTGSSDSSIKNKAEDQSKIIDIEIDEENVKL